MAKLSSGMRNALRPSQFALPGKGSGSYPIPDASHARAALSMGAKYASPSKLATIKRKVKAKFPGIK